MPKSKFQRGNSRTVDRYQNVSGLLAAMTKHEQCQARKAAPSHVAPKREPRERRRCHQSSADPLWSRKAWFGDMQSFTFPPAQKWASKWAVRANQQRDERTAQYYVWILGCSEPLCEARIARRRTLPSLPLPSPIAEWNLNSSSSPFPQRLSAQSIHNRKEHRFCSLSLGFFSVFLPKFLKVIKKGYFFLSSDCLLR